MSRTEPTRVLATMVADLFHYGHVNFLREARALGDHLTVGLITDRHAASYKRHPILTYEERRAVVQACRYVDEVIELEEDTTDDSMKAHGFQICAYAVASDEEEARYRAILWKIVDPAYFHRISYTSGISTSAVIDRILSRRDLQRID